MFHVPTEMIEQQLVLVLNVRLCMHTFKSENPVLQILCICTPLWQQWKTSKSNASNMPKMKTASKR